MIDSCRFRFQRLNADRLLARSLFVTALATTGVLAGIVPSFSQRSISLDFSTSASAQAVEPAKVQDFVRSTLEIELAREAALQSLGGKAPRFECDLGAGTVANLNSFAGELRQPIQSFCNQSQSILQQNGLSATDFRTIKTNYESNPAQYSQITGTFQRLCQEGRYRGLQICR